MKKTMLLAAAAATATGFAASNVSAVDVEMYGQVNKSLLVFDDGRSTETNIVDNDTSSTRLGFKGTQGLDNGLTASVLFEVEMQSNASNAIVQNNTGASTVPTGVASTPSSNGGTFAERHARVGLAGDWGAVFLGQMSTATDGVTEQDLVGARDVLNSEAEDLGGALFFRNGVGASANVTVAQTTDNMDGIGAGANGDRADAIRYDSPIFNGFQLRVATAQGGDIDGAVYYNGKYDAFAVKGGIGFVAFSNNNTGTDVIESQVSGSLSVKHDSGVAGTVAYGQQSLENETAGNEDPSFYYVKLGYEWDAFEVAADYGMHDNILTTTTLNHEVTAFGLGAQYNMGNGTSVGAFYRMLDLDLTGATTDEINLYGANLRVKF